MATKLIFDEPQASASPEPQRRLVFDGEEQPQPRRLVFDQPMEAAPEAEAEAPANLGPRRNRWEGDQVAQSRPEPSINQGRNRTGSEPPPPDLTDQALANIEAARPRFHKGPPRGDLASGFSSAMMGQVLSPGLEAAGEMAGGLGFTGIQDRLQGGSDWLDELTEAVNYQSPFDYNKAWEAVKRGDVGEAAGMFAGATPGEFGVSAAHMAGIALVFPFYGMATLERLADERAKNKGLENATNREKLEVAPYAAGVLALDRLGLHYLTKAGSAVVQKVGLEILKRFGQGALAEGITEGIQENLELKAETLGTGKEPSMFDEVARSVVGTLFGATMGGVFGGMHGASEPGMRLREMDHERAAADFEIRVKTMLAQIRTGQIPNPNGPIYSDGLPLSPQGDWLSREFIGPLGPSQDIVDKLFTLDLAAALRLQNLAAQTEGAPMVGPVGDSLSRNFKNPPPSHQVTRWLENGFLPDRARNEVSFESLAAGAKRIVADPGVFNNLLPHVQDWISVLADDNSSIATKTYVRKKLWRSFVAVDKRDWGPAGDRALAELGLDKKVTRVSEMAPGEVLYADFLPDSITASTQDKKTRLWAAKLAQSMLKTFAPEARLVLIESEDPQELGHMGHRSGTDAAGNAFRGYEIALNFETLKQAALTYNTTLETQIAATLAHEVGHLIAWELMHSADLTTQKAILNAYRRWLRETPRMNAKEFWKTRSGSMGNRYASILGPASAAFRTAWDLSLQEFFADHVGRFITGRLGDDAELWGPYARKLHRFFQDVKKQKPEIARAIPEIEDFLDSLRFRSLGEWARTRALDTTSMVSDAQVETQGKVSEQTEPEKLGQQIGKNLNLPEETNSGLARIMSGVARFNTFVKYSLTLPQLERMNRHVPGMTRFVEGVRAWWAESGIWKDRANETLKFARKLEGNKQALKAFTNFAYEITQESSRLGRKLNPQEKEALARKVGLTPEGEAVWRRMEIDFRMALRALFTELRKDAERELGDDLLALEKRLGELRDDQRKLENQDYFPLSRFGQYAVKVVAKENMTVGGREFKTDQIIYYGLRENKGDWKRLSAEIRRKYAGQNVDISFPVMPEDKGISYQNMPGHLIDKIVDISVDEFINSATDENGNGPTAEAIAAFKADMAKKIAVAKLDMSPADSVRKRMKERKLTPGFSEDALRSYASYMSSFSNFIAKIKHSHEMLSGLDQMRRAAAAASRIGNAESLRAGNLRNAMQHHYDYLMNPENEWASLRSLGAIWYLGLNPKSAFVNLTQIALATQPYLEQRYGLRGSVKELGRAIKDLTATWKRGDGRVEEDLAEALDWGFQSQFLNESLATELGAYADGNTLNRAIPGVSRRYARGAVQGSMWLFQQMEKVNRLITFSAAYRLERDRLVREQNTTWEELEATVVNEATGATAADEVHLQARRAAREAVEVTQGEYARWARPRAMQGKKSVAFLFKLYMQHMSYILFTDPSKLRFLRNAFFLGGAMGLPFAEDIMNFVTWLWKQGQKVTGGANERMDLAGKLREGTVELTDTLKKQVHEDMEWLSDSLNHAPDLFLHGLGRYGMGLLWADLSGSMSLGRVAPGVDTLNRETGPFEDPYSSIGRAVETVGGPVAGIPISIFKAAVSDEPDQWRRWEKALPIAMQSLSKSLRYGVRGEETGYRGETIHEFDPGNPWDWVKIGGQGAGFQIREISEKRERSWAKKQAERFYQARRSSLMRAYFHAWDADDREAKADAWDSIMRFNKERPDNVPGITGKDIRRSVKARVRGQVKAEQGLPDSKKYTRMFSDIDQTFPSARWEEEAP